MQRVRREMLGREVCSFADFFDDVLKHLCGFRWAEMGRGTHDDESGSPRSCRDLINEWP